MKLNRKDLRKMIAESFDNLIGQVPDVEPEQLIKAKLRKFHSLSMKLNNVYNHHRSWDQAPNEQEIIDQIHFVREKLYSMGLRSDHLNRVKDMSYEQFDTLIGMDNDEFRLWKGNYWRDAE